MRTPVVICILIVIVLTIGIAEAFAWVKQEWLPLGPTGGSIHKVICEIQSPDFCYAAGPAVLYRSEDQGKSWTPVARRSVLQIVVHLLTNKVYFLIAGGGTELWQTTNHGKSFARLARLNNVTGISVAPEHPEWIFAMKTGQMEVSKNGGRTWKTVKTPFLYNRELLASPFNQNTWYLSALVPKNHYFQNIPTLLSTTNSGTTWSLVTRGGEYHCAYRFFFDPAKTGRILGYRCGGVDLLTPSGFTPLSDVTGTLEITAPAYGPIYLLKSNDRKTGVIMRSLNRGKTWHTLGGDFARIAGSAVSIAATSIAGAALMIGTAGGGIYLCRTFHLTCTPANDGIEGISNATDVVVSPDHPSSVLTLVGGRVYKGDEQGEVNGSFVYRSTNGGKDWQDIKVRPYNGNNIVRLIGHASDRNSIIAFDAPLDILGKKRDLFITRDGGQHWLRHQVLLYFENATWDPQDAQTLYLWSQAGGIHKTTDGGESFSEFRFPQNERRSLINLIVDPFDPKTLYLSSIENYRAIVLKTTDGGVTFARLEPQIPRNRHLYNWIALTQADQYLAMDQWGTIYKTTNGGNFWSKWSHLEIAGPSSDAKLYAVDNSGVHYFLVNNGRLLKSHDAGIHWTDITPSFSSENPQPVYVNSLSDPRVHPLYASTSSGVYLIR